MRTILAILVLLAAAAGAAALDPRQADYVYTYTLYPPDGFSAKKTKVLPRADPRQKQAYPLIRDGRFTPAMQWYYAIGSDPRAFAAWWNGYFADPAVWSGMATPVYRGDGAANQGHRIISWVHVLKELVDADPEIDAPVKQALCSEEWKRAAEATIIATIDARGLLTGSGHTADMACLFHFLRTKWGAMGLRIDHLYDLGRAQDLISSLLTLPWIISPEDRWLDPPAPDYLERLGAQVGGAVGDVRLVRRGQLLYPGGMFIGWKDKPALHGTWDGLAIINSLFKYYRDPDPRSAGSIFHKWWLLPEAQKAPATAMITTCARRLWLDWSEGHQATWCWVRDGRPTEDRTRPSEAPFLPAHDGYGDAQLGWAVRCWEEVFGDPARNTNDGVQALLAIAHGGVLATLKTPRGQQEPGRYDFAAKAGPERDGPEPDGQAEPAAPAPGPLKGAQP